MNTEEFIQRASKRNPDYGYGTSIYSGSQEEVEIRCPKHGLFLQKAYNHLRGSKCPKCRNEIISKKNFERGLEMIKRSGGRFKERAFSVHGEKYSYDLVDYQHPVKKVKIICPIHGVFEQTPTCHLTGGGGVGCGCNKCGLDIATNNLKVYNRSKNLISKGEFIERATRVHNNFYNYEQVDYKLAVKKVKIICPIHGVFEQVPDSHLSGRGCPLCNISNSSRGEKYIKEFLEKNKIPFEAQKKFIGCRDKQSLSFDFWIPKLSLLIEYDGAHHFQPISYFGGLKAFKGIQRRDEIKNKFALENNLDLKRISYLEYSNLENILKAELQLT